MSEIYQEKMAGRGDRSYDSVLRRITHIAMDPNLFNIDQMQDNLSEISKLAEDDGLDTTYVDFMLEVLIQGKGE